MSGNWWCGPASLLREGAALRRNSQTGGRMRGEFRRPDGGPRPRYHQLPNMSHGEKTNDLPDDRAQTQHSRHQPQSSGRQFAEGAKGEEQDAELKGPERFTIPNRG